VRRSLPILVLLLATTASCGRAPDRSDSRSPDRSPPQTSYEGSSNAADSAAEVAPGQAGRSASPNAGPNVGPTAAPGVAFNYRYAFRLAAPRIAEVQERHAQMCERLTVARCRITGMLYRVVNDRDIEAMLAFKLDPAAARAFGRDAVGVVVQSEGMLTESEITGEDVGTTIRQAGRGIAELEADLARIEARLRAGVPASERGELTYQAEQLRAQIRALRETREVHQESLATTPMVFRYGSGDLVPGFAQPETLKQTLDRAWENFLNGGKILLVVLITLLPWAFALALVAAIVAFVRRRFMKRNAAATEPAAS
jgi:hypothetical protein